MVGVARIELATPVGIEKALQMARRIVDGEAELDLPTEAQNVVALLADHVLQLHAKLRKMDPRLAALQRSDETARRLATIPGIGPIGATALVRYAKEKSDTVDPRFIGKRRRNPALRCGVNFPISRR